MNGVDILPKQTINIHGYRMAHQVKLTVERRHRPQALNFYVDLIRLNNLPPILSTHLFLRNNQLPLSLIISDNHIATGHSA